MTVGTTTRVKTYTGNGVTTAFASTFQFFEIAVYADAVLVNPSEYVVTQLAPGLTGTVTFNVAPPAGTAIVISGDTEPSQQTDYVEGHAFPAEAHERALDRLAMAIQELKRDTGYSVRWLDFPGRIVRVNAETGGFEAMVPDQAGYTYVDANGVPSFHPINELGTPQTLAATTQALAGLMLKVGDPILSMAAVPRSGFLRLGETTTTYNKSAYPELSSFLATLSYPWGSTSTTFSLPPAAGYFLRFAGTTTGVDPDGPRAAGSTQTDLVKAHTHTGTTSTDGAHTHNYNFPGASNNAGAGVAVAAPSGFTATATTSAGAHNHTLNINANVGVENRPKNVAFHVDILASSSGAIAALGSFGFAYAFDASTAASDPGAGKVRLNNASLAAVTALYLSNTDAWGVNQSNVLGDLSVTQVVRLSKIGAQGNSLVAVLSGAPTVGAAFTTVPVTIRSSGGAFAAAEPLAFEVMSGAKGLASTVPGPAAWLAAVAWSTGLVCSAAAPATVVTFGGETYQTTTSHTAGAVFDASKFLKLAAKGADSAIAGPTGPGYGGTSTSSATLGIGSQTLYIGTGYAYTTASRARFSCPTGSMEGAVTAYSAGNLTINVVNTSDVIGSGTSTSWTVSLIGQPGSGAGTPGGTSGQAQINSAGSFAGTSGYVWNSSTQVWEHTKASGGFGVELQGYTAGTGNNVKFRTIVNRDPFTDGSGVGGENYTNEVVAWGWNISDIVGVPATAGTPSFWDGREYKYNIGGKYNHEWHIESKDTAGVQHRWHSYAARHDGTFASSLTSTDQIVWHDFAATSTSVVGNLRVQFDLRNSVSYWGSSTTGFGLNFNKNNYAPFTQRNAANSAFLSLPFFNASDKLQVSGQVEFYVNGSVATGAAAVSFNLNSATLAASSIGFELQGPALTNKDFGAFNFVMNTNYNHFATLRNSNASGRSQYIAACGATGRASFKATNDTISWVSGINSSGNYFLGSDEFGTDNIFTVDKTNRNLAFVKPPKVPSYTAATLPSASTYGGGSLVYVTDANATTPRSTIAGGGSNKVLGFSDGTNWLIAA